MDRNHAALFRVCLFWSGVFVAAVVSVVLRPGVGGGFGSELLLLELISEPTSLAHPAILHFSFGLFVFCVGWFGLLVGVVQNAAGEDRTPDLRIMRPTRCQLRYCRMCLHWGWFPAGFLHAFCGSCAGLRLPAVSTKPGPRGLRRVGLFPARFLARILRVVCRFAVPCGV